MWNHFSTSHTQSATIQIRDFERSFHLKQVLALTLLLATNQANTLSFDRAFDFPMNFAREKELEFWLDKVKKNDLTMNKIDDNNDQTLSYGRNEDRVTR